MPAAMENIRNFEDFPSFNCAQACRDKAASLRAAARDAISDESAQAYLKIALKWDEIAVDFETVWPIH
jgi:hypothetical protein